MNAPDEALRRATSTSRVKDLRRKRTRDALRRVVVFVGVPTVLAASYLVFYASRQYESVSMFTINSADAASGMMASFMGAIPGSAAARDVVVVREYVLSRDMLDLLIREQRFLEHYRDARIDWLSRLRPDQSSEDVYDYYLDHVDVEHDELGSTLTLKVRAFTSADAKRLSEAILAAAEAKVNTMDEDARGDSIALAQREFDRAEQRLTAARRKVLELQRQGHELNPVESAGTLMAVRGSLEGALAAARAELQAMLGTMLPTAPQVIAQRQRVDALAGQVQSQRLRMTGRGNDGLGASIAQFEPIVVEKELAQLAYESAAKALETARIDASRQHRYLVTIANPSAPNRWTHPIIWRGILAVFLGSFTLLGIGLLVVASVREHANV